MSRFRSDNEFTVTTGKDGQRSFGEHDDRWGPPQRQRRGGGSGGGGGGKYKGRDSYYGRNDRGGRGGGSDRGGRGDYLSRGPRGITKREKNVHFNPRARLDDEGDDMMGSSESSSSRRRFNPYSARPSSRRGGKGSFRERERGSVRFDTGKLQGDWFKVTIPYGKKHSKELILKTIQSLINTPIHPVHYHHDSRKSVFYIKDSNTAKLIKQSTHKATLPDGFKLILVVSPSSAPVQVLTEEVKTKLKLAMSNRYNPTTKLLDLGSLHKDEGLSSEGYYMSLSRPNVMSTVIEIIKEHIPEMTALILKSNKLYNLRSLKDLVEVTPNLSSLDLSNNELKTIEELNYIKQWPLVTLNLNLNTLCDTFQDQLSYISAVRKKFSKIVHLDGNELAPAIKFDLETPTTLPPTKGSYFCDDNLQALIVKFLREFYSIYDSDNRHPLIAAYHDEASFSLSSSYNGALQYKQPGLSDYFNESRNLLKMSKNPDKSYRLLKHGKLTIVSQLCLLPKTSHDPNSFVVDVGVVTPNLMSFTVSGVFKESDSKIDKPPIRAFSRQFVAIPSGSGILLTNDVLFISNALPQQQQSAFKNTGPTPSSSPVLANPPALPADMSVTSNPSLPTAMSMTGPPSLPTDMSLTGPSTSINISQLQQQQMVRQFVIDSKMNIEWSTKCLQENLWNYEKAGQIFLELNKNGKIPPEAFVKCE